MDIGTYEKEYLELNSMMRNQIKVKVVYNFFFVLSK